MGNAQKNTALRINDDPSRHEHDEDWPKPEVMPLRPSFAKPIEDHSSPSRGKILVMDDDKIVCEVTSHILQRLKYEAEFARDGAEAIKLYQAAQDAHQPFDAVILDLTVPGGMNGREAIKRLREMDPQVKGIVSTGYSNDPVVKDFRQYGFSGCVVKPYKVQDLNAALQDVMNGDKDLRPETQDSRPKTGRSSVT